MRRGVVWPYPYLYAGEHGEQLCPVDEVDAWVATNPDACASAMADPYAADSRGIWNVSGAVMATVVRLPPRGSGCHVWTIRDGKLAAFQQYTDTWLIAQVTADQPAPIRGE